MRPRGRRGMTLVEIMLVVSLISLVMTGVVYMIQQGGSHFDSSIWYKDNLTKLQVAMARIEEDLYKASNRSEYVTDSAGLEEVKVTPQPFRYARGSRAETIKDPETDAERTVQAIPGVGSDSPGSDVERKVFSFVINRLGQQRLGRNEPSYSMTVTGSLKGGDLYYEKTWLGSPPSGAVPDQPFAKTVIMSNVDCLWIGHENIPSEMEPGEFDGAVLKLFIRLRDLKSDRVRSEGRTLFITRSIKLNVTATDTLSGGS